MGGGGFFGGREPRGEYDPSREGGAGESNLASGSSPKRTRSLEGEISGNSASS